MKKQYGQLLSSLRLAKCMGFVLFLTCLDKFDLLVVAQTLLRPFTTMYHAWRDTGVSGPLRTFLVWNFFVVVLLKKKKIGAVVCISMLLICAFMPIHFLRRFSSHNTWLLFWHQICLPHLHYWTSSCTIRLPTWGMHQDHSAAGEKWLHNSKWAKWKSQYDSWPKISLASLGLFALFPYLRKYSQI